jgi:DNA modification methylase
MIVFGDCRDTMRQWAKDGIKAQTCVTSPPYYGLRDYGTAKWDGGDADCDHSISMPTKWNDPKRGTSVLRPETSHRGGSSANCHKCGATRIDLQIGLEETPEEYIKAMVEVFRCVWDVLEDNGTLWVNIGDSYASQGGRQVEQTVRHTGDYVNAGQMGSDGVGTTRRPPDGIKAKDLIGIPWMLAFALRADGWYLRQDIIWHKPNPMPESVQDRCTKAHEYIFLLSKSSKYYYDIESIKEKAHTTDSTNRNRDESRLNNTPGRTRMAGLTTNHYEMKNKRSVWTVTTKPYTGAHFATFPTDLIEPCIKAGCPEGGVVLDPFMGSGTTAYVAALNGRKYLGCELNPAYKPLQDERIRNAEMETAQMSLI